MRGPPEMLERLRSSLSPAGASMLVGKKRLVLDLILAAPGAE